MHRFANPTQFLRLGSLVLPWVSAAAGVAIAAGLYLGLFRAPPDYQQGETVRIMYIHVPSAWLAMLAYTVVAGASAAGLIWRHPVAFLSAKAAAPIGACFTLLCLATGVLWGKPMWGAWWVWDARLTSVLILFFFYLGYIALNGAFDDPTRGERASAVLALVGAVNLPVVKFSVDWWNTLHQPASVVKLGGPAIHPAMLAPLLLMALGFTLYFVALLLLGTRREILGRRLRAAQLGQAAT